MNRKASFWLLIPALLGVEAVAMDKDELLSKYRDKGVVVMNDGISVSFCRPATSNAAMLSFIPEPPALHIVVKDLETVTVRSSNPPEEICTVDPIRKNEVLKLDHVAFSRGYLMLRVKTISPHSVTVGVGAFAHQSTETGGRAYVALRAGKDGKDMDGADALAAHWFHIAAEDATTGAAELGNTTNGAFVNQVKSGMSFAEVESALGVPKTRVDLGEKVLYKYQDMTVEFHDGKVTDVR